MDNQMCNGVFAPVCSPEVCDVPKIPYYQDLMIGYGFVNRSCDDDSSGEVRFQIKIYRKLLDVFGRLRVEDQYGNVLLVSEQLEAYHAATEEKMVAIFHYDDPNTESSRELTVYASTPTKKKEAKFYIYSAPLMDETICIGGTVKDGDIIIKQSEVELEH